MHVSMYTTQMHTAETDKEVQALDLDPSKPVKLMTNELMKPW